MVVDTDVVEVTDAEEDEDPSKLRHSRTGARDMLKVISLSSVNVYSGKTSIGTKTLA
jgi:hypothetical protein